MTKKREVFGWAIFDVANSAYTTTIITVAFNVIFAKLIVLNESTNNNGYAYGGFLWSLILSISYFLTAISSPIFGALSDVTRRRKAFLAFSVGLCSLTTAFLYFASPGAVLLASFLLIISNIGFALSENFISAFLPHISRPNNIGKISGLAWGMGYFGGLGSIMLCLALTGLDYQMSNFERLRLIGPLTAAFFVVFSLPTFVFLREPSDKNKTLPIGKISASIGAAYREIFLTLKHLRHHQDLYRFLISFFFFQGGLSIVISFAAIYGDLVVKLDGNWQAIFFVSLQLSAAGGAFVFGILQHHLGAIRTVNLTLVIWISTILTIYFLEDLARVFAISDLKLFFVIVGNFAGMCLGATQSSARALVGMFSPPQKSGEFYGFWGLAGKMAAVFSILVFGVLQKVFDLKTAMLFCASFFLIGLVINLFVNESRGKEQAQIFDYCAFK